MDDIKPQIEPAILVVFGITGDLAKRYILPSLYHLVKYDQLHADTEIVGLTRGDMQLDDLLASIELCVSEKDGICDPLAVQKLKKHLKVRQMNVDDNASYSDLKQYLDDLEESHNVHMHRLFYLSVPPDASGNIIEKLGENGLHTGCAHGVAQSRLLAEKPFGHTYEAAQDLIANIAKYFKEDQIYRIDHYLAKETVQNFLNFKYNNPIFEPLWNNNYVDYIEVLAEEKLGIENRVRFYEQTGAVRDLIQSHLLQILALITMEQPPVLQSDAIHASKQSVMQDMEAVTLRYAVRGQYKTYTSEVGNEKSLVETFAAFRINIKNERWDGVPMIIKTGKSLARKLSEVNVVFKPTAHSPHHNILSFRISPKEGIELSLRVKQPGFDDKIQPVEMDFDYKTSFSTVDFSPTAYERVLVDAVRGDHTLFATAEEILESWRVVMPAVSAWAESNKDLVQYDNGSTGTDISLLYPDVV